MYQINMSLVFTRHCTCLYVAIPILLSMHATYLPIRRLTSSDLDLSCARNTSLLSCRGWMSPYQAFFFPCEDTKPLESTSTHAWYTPLDFHDPMSSQPRSLTQLKCPQQTQYCVQYQSAVSCKFSLLLNLDQARCLL